MTQRDDRVPLSVTAYQKMVEATVGELAETIATLKADNAALRAVLRDRIDAVNWCWECDGGYHEHHNEGCSIGTLLEDSE